jgi:hypothetical protein
VTSFTAAVANVCATPRVWRGNVLSAALISAPAVAALIVGVQALRHTDSRNIGPMGLVEALPTQLYVVLVVLTTSFFAALFLTPTLRPTVLGAHVIVFTVLLHGAATIVEPLPRFVPAWLHVGFTDYIARTGDTLPELDARFSWPGMFALAAAATRAAGMKDAMPLLGWTPVVFNLLYVAVVYRVGRVTSNDARTAWLAAWLFIPASWVGQDYFSPQGLNYFFYLVIILLLLLWFRPPRFEHLRGTGTRLLRGVWLTRLLRVVGLPRQPMLHESEAATATPTTLVALMGITVIIFTASVGSHQLTPTAILVSVTALVAARRCVVRTLPVLLVVILAGYISYLTVTYWSGHLEELVGSFGRIGKTVDANVSERVQGDRAHLIVLQIRQLVAVTIWGLAAWGAWRRMRHGHGNLALLVLAGAPFLLLFLQSYGGEVFLRIYALALPFMVVFVAASLLPASPRPRTLATAVLACVVAVGLTGAFFIARYGNENFEHVRPADARAVDWVYSNATPGVSLVALTSNVPWRARMIEQYRYTPLGEDLGPDSLASIETAMTANPRGAYLILTPGQYAMGESFYGRPPGWGTRIERDIAASGRFRLVYARDGAKVFILAGKGTV